MSLQVDYVHYNFTEILLGEFVLQSNHFNREMSYVLSLDNGCGVDSLIKSGSITRVTGMEQPYVVFKNLSPGRYKLSITFEGLQSKYAEVFKTFSNLERLIIEGVHDLFYECNNCGQEVDTACLLANMVTFSLLNEFSFNPHTLSSFRCALTDKANCNVREERFRGTCDKPNKMLIAYYYLEMYSKRIFGNKEDLYKYAKTKSYISANIINLN